MFGGLAFFESMIHSHPWCFKHQVIVVMVTQMDWSGGWGYHMIGVENKVGDDLKI